MSDSPNIQVDLQYLPHKASDPINITNIPSGIGGIYSPVSIYIIICFFCVVTIIVYRSSLYNIPSIVTLLTLLIIMLVSSASLIILGNITTAGDWGCLIIVTLAILLVTYSILIPTTLFYPKLS